MRTHLNPALAGVALAVVIGARRRRFRPERPDGHPWPRRRRCCSVRSWPILPPSRWVSRHGSSAAVLAGYLLWIAARGAGVWTGGSRLGWPAEVLVAAAAAAVGYGSHGLGCAGRSDRTSPRPPGSPSQRCRSPPIANGRDVVRLGMGLLLLASGAILVRTALGGTPEPLEEVVIAGLIAALGGAIAVLGVSARAEGVDFELAADRSARARRLPDAHPIDSP